jgi:molybdopterin-binding protein
MKVSARNQIKGMVKAVTPGAVSSEVKVELSGGDEVVAIITKASAEGMGLAEGKEVYVIIKATSVMIGTD